MNYISTRGQAPVLDFKGTLLTGLASDGGLNIPERWPRFTANEMRSMQGLSYQDLVCKIMKPLIGDSFSDPAFAEMVKLSYERFLYPEVTPLETLDYINSSSKISLLNLTGTPTLSFKCVAMQLLGRMINHSLIEADSYANIIGATSGDTGSSAEEAFRGLERIAIFILFPYLRTSMVQQLQMTTVPDANVHALAVDKSTFDDDQSMVKEMFGDPEFKKKFKVTAINSINWGRIAAQVVYYFHSALKLGAPDKEVSFVVPTGNFGDAFAGYVAKQMGLPIKKLVLATNNNDILHRFLETGIMLSRPVVETHSPSMDIVVSSNFERLLFDFLGRDSNAVSANMESLKKTGQFSVSQNVLTELRKLFASGTANNVQTEQVITDTYKSFGRLIDTHTAVGLSVAQQLIKRGNVFGDEPIVCLETAHPAKFPDVVKKCTGVHPPLPEHLKDLFDRPERLNNVPNDLKVIKEYISANALAM